MTLYRIIADLVRSSGRASTELPRGLWLVHYPANGDQPAQLVAGRYLSRPSETELDVVLNALLDVLDASETRVAYDITPWAETANGDWHGFAISWRTTAVTDAFSGDPDRAAPIRRALERRDERIAERRRKEQSARRRARPTAAKPGPKPML